MIVPTIEQRNYNNKNASFNVYYSTIKECFLKRKWTKLKNKNNTIYVFYKQGLSLEKSVSIIAQIVK